MTHAAGRICASRRSKFKVSIEKIQSLHVNRVECTTTTRVSFSAEKTPMQVKFDIKVAIYHNATLIPGSRLLAGWLCGKRGLLIFSIHTKSTF
jgi:hypothetical protein